MIGLWRLRDLRDTFLNGARTLARMFDGVLDMRRIARFFPLSTYVIVGIGAAILAAYLYASCAFGALCG